MHINFVSAIHYSHKNIKDNFRVYIPKTIISFYFSLLCNNYMISFGATLCDIKIEIKRKFNTACIQYNTILLKYQQKRMKRLSFLRYHDLIVFFLYLKKSSIELEHTRSIHDSITIL